MSENEPSRSAGELHVAKFGLMLVAVAALALGTIAWRKVSASAGWASGLPDLVSSQSQPPSGKELLLVFIGASDCDASQSSELPAAVATVKARLQTLALERDYSFATIGVATDRNFADGVKFLSQFGAFDEIDIGRNWFNSFAVSLFYRDLPGRPALPQLVLLERELDIRQEATLVSKDELIARKIGVDEIIRWAADSAAIRSLR